MAYSSPARLKRILFAAKDCKFITLLLTALCMLQGFIVNAGGGVEIDPIISKLTGATLVKNAVADASYTAVGGQSNPKIKNIISLNIIEESTRFISADFTATIRVRIDYGNSVAYGDFTEQDLVVNYSKAEGAKYNVKQYFTFEAASHVKVTVLATSPDPLVQGGLNLADVLLLENKILVTEFFNFDANVTPANLQTDLIKTAEDELVVKWDAWVPSKGVTHTQLEWAWVETEMEPNYYVNGVLNTDRIFRNNATRVDLPVNIIEYTIPKLYDGAGNIHYRIRAVNIDENGTRLDGPWSNRITYAFSGHEPKFNWQVTTSFAEEGKRNTVIEYYDGSLRPRQTVTKDNENKTTIASETFYDPQGRPAIQILPVPEINPGGEASVIKYKHNLNFFNTQLPGQDPADIFDLKPINSLEPLVGSIDHKGADYYYSDKNPEHNTGINKYIPDAGGYPYTQTQYTPDGTGRVMIQSGVGAAHKMGSGRETKYYYGSPAQEELDGLFGTEVGNRTHYFKNMVKDANGQLSVSYVDMHGRTIATALAGAPTTNLQSLNFNNNDVYTNQSSQQVVRDLLDDNTNIVKENAVESVNTILVSAPGTYTFDYSLDPDKLQLASCTPEVQLCYDCLYDLEISITDETGDTNPLVWTITNVSLDPDDDCSTPVSDLTVMSSPIGSQATVSGTTISFSRSLEPGSYSVRKTLSISESSFQRYLQLYSSKAMCQTKEQLTNSIFADLKEETGCDDPSPEEGEIAAACTACMENLGESDEEFKDNYLSSLGISEGQIIPQLEAEIRAAYQAAYDNCQLLCNTTSTHSLETIRLLMLEDMKPYTGQYAKEDPSGTTMYNKYDIFSTQFAGQPFFKNPKKEDNITGPYLDVLGKTDQSLYALYPDLNTLTKDKFKELFKDSWANSLLVYHPEFRKLKFAEDNLKESYDWIDKFMSISGYDIANAAPLNYVLTSDNTTSAPYNDPFYILAPAVDYRNVMVQKITSNFVNLGSGNASMWQLAYGQVKYKDVTDQAQRMALTLLAPAQPPYTDLSTDERDELWQMFQSLYAHERTKDVNRYIAANVTPAVENNDLIAQEYMLHFPETDQQVASQGHQTGDISNIDASWQWWPPATSPNSPPVNVDLDPNTNNTAAYTNRCESYIQRWKAALRPCIEAHTSDPELRETILLQITNDMKQVCINGSDAANPYGSSNVPDSYTGTGPRSFEQVITNVFTTRGISKNLLCNPFVVDWPKPYGKGPKMFEEITNSVDGCACDNYTAIAAQAAAAGYTPTNLFSLNSYLKLHYTDTLTPVLHQALVNCSSWPRVLICGQTDTTASCYDPNPCVADCENLNPSGPYPADCAEWNSVISCFLENYNAGVSDTLTFSTQPANNPNEIALAQNNFVDWSSGSSPDLAIFRWTYNNNPYIGRGLLKFDLSSIPSSAIITSANLYLYSYPPPTLKGNFADANFGSGNAMFVRQVTSDWTTATIGWNNQPATTTTNQISVPHTAQSMLDLDLDVTNMVSSMVASNANYGFSLRLQNEVIYNLRTFVGSHNTTHTTKYPKLVIKYKTSDCQSEFVSFYNNHYGASLSWNQIATLYNATCEQTLNVCSPCTTTSFCNCHDELEPRQLSSPQPLPAFLKCGSSGKKRCIDCKQMSALTGEFKTYFNSPDDAAPVFNSENPTDNEIASNIAFAKFINYRTGLQYNWIDYAKAARDADPACNLDNYEGNTNATQNVICGETVPVTDLTDIITYVDECQAAQDKAVAMANEIWLERTRKLKQDFEASYRAKCLAVQNTETFTVTYSNGEYHYTLYYYDMAGSLVKTVPPAGVKPDFRKVYTDEVKQARANGEARLRPHQLITQYRYNSLGQVIAQNSPDANTSHFWYDKVGRLVVSQNAQQEADGKYSYTIFDELGRIKEVGQKENSIAMSQTISEDKHPTISLMNWILTQGGTREQITFTVYDLPHPTGLQPLLIQQNLRNRVSYTGTIKLATDPDPQQYAATFYSYDIHGNVEILLHDYKGVPEMATQTQGNRYKVISYNYDLISGKVNMVNYQPDYFENGEWKTNGDRFFHKYKYDALNRLTEVHTSRDKMVWERDAAYQYYKHGPLARTEYGQLRLQGMDYAYTIQGWLKGVNSTAISASGATCPEGTVLGSVLNVTARTQYAQPPVYTAAQEINFDPGFESVSNDVFETFINPNGTVCTPSQGGTSIIPYTQGDMGRDGDATDPLNVNGNAARDAFGFALNYFNNDYKPLGTGVQTFANGMHNLPQLNNDGMVTGAELFNGNIASMLVSIPKLGIAGNGNSGTNPILYGYRYDQLNRIVGMNAYKNDPANTQPNIFSPVVMADYKERISYDPNGNILSYHRNGTSAPPQQGAGTGGTDMDQLTYKYLYTKTNNTEGEFIPGQPVTDPLFDHYTNQLASVQDAIGDANYTIDIDAQSAFNYEYDKIGNLIKDRKEGILNAGWITWTVYGKISSITKDADKNEATTDDRTTITYTYDASGNRITKTVIPPAGAAKTTIYARDASGNVMSVYEKETAGAFRQTEIHLYGSSRIGMITERLVPTIEDAGFNTDFGKGILHTFTRNEKIFELSNHLGNVLVTISDKKKAVDSDNDGEIDYNEADVVSANDYYPFGMMMPGRKFSASSSGYRYGFNGKEQDKDLHGLTAYDYGFRIYNPAIGRFLSVDPLTKEYPWYTPYQFAGNKPIIAIDLDGLEEQITIIVTGKKIKPVSQTQSAINIFDKIAVNAAAINNIVSQLQIKEIQQKQTRVPVSNFEWAASSLTPAESRKIIDETVSQFTISTETINTYQHSVDINLVTEAYSKVYSFNYSLLGDEKTIKNVKEIVSFASTITEYGADVTGSKFLNKVSAHGSIVANVLNENYIGISEAITTYLGEAGITYGASKLPGIVAATASKAAGIAVATLSLALTNSAPKDMHTRKEEAIENLRNRTIAGLLFLFEKNNKPTIEAGRVIKPTYNDNLVPASRPPIVPNP